MSMDMASSTMSMSMPMSISSSTVVSATPSAMSSNSTGMDMSMDMGMGGNSCQISMLWNWYTVGACFISSEWQIASSGAFAGSCIGVICLVMCLPFLSRLHRAFDDYVIRSHQLKSKETSKPIRPTIWEQAIKAFIHMVQFAVAYFVMLLAMYYNGYIIISILIGAFLGYFVFQWESIGQRYENIGSESASEVTHCCG